MERGLEGKLTTPGISSWADSSSSMGTHSSVPGNLPMILIRVCVDFWMTNTSEKTTEATRPVYPGQSTIQADRDDRSKEGRTSIEKQSVRMKVPVISAKSVHALIRQKKRNSCGASARTE